MIVGDISELRMMGVFHRGTPNEERIVFKVNEPVNMGQFGIMLGIKQQAGYAIPIKDNLYWFDDGYVNMGDWIFVYTGPGEARVADLPANKEKLYSLHWGRNRTILLQPEIVPILFRVDAVIVAAEMQALPSAAG